MLLWYVPDEAFNEFHNRNGFFHIYIVGNLFVSVQPFDDVKTYNRKFLDAHNKKAAEGDYKKGMQICALFEEDRAAFYPLPGRKFHVCRYEHLKADGYGKVCIGGKHYYSTRPEYVGKRDVLVGIMAHYIDIYNNDGKIRPSDVRAAIERMMGYRLNVPSVQGPSLEVYDRIFLCAPLQEGGGAV